MTATIHVGHVLDVLRTLPDESVQMCVTSPPYWGIRDYNLPSQVWGGDADCQHDWVSEGKHLGGSGKQGATSIRPDRSNIEAQLKQRNAGETCVRCDAWCGHLGLEPTMEMFIGHIVEVFREVRRVLRSDGVLWLNIGDSYSAAGRTGHGTRVGAKQGTNRASAEGQDQSRASAPGLKPKDLMMMPARVAIALQDDGWTLRSDIIWVKRSPMPESAQDRPTVAHEHIFLLSKKPKYFYDAAAVATPLQPKTFTTIGCAARATGNDEVGKVKSDNWGKTIDERQPKLNDDGTLFGANLRNVWSIASQPYKGAHFAVFPEKLVELCVKAGTSEKGCCGNCGSPIKRRTVRSTTYESGSGKAGNKPDGKHGDSVNGGNMRLREGPTIATETTGWEPTCNCFTESEWKDDGMGPHSCVVLDPFAGSGTTGVVCERLGRDSILIELNPDYAINQAARRIRDDAPLLNRVEVIQ